MSRLIFTEKPLTQTKRCATPTQGLGKYVPCAMQTFKVHYDTDDTERCVVPAIVARRTCPLRHEDDRSAF